MFIAFAVVVILVVDGVVEGEAVKVTADASGDDASVIKRNTDVLHVVRKRKQLYRQAGTLRVS